MTKIAIVCQRYGVEVNGGAEYHARVLAEQLARGYDVQILTTTALDYHGWANHYDAGDDQVNGIPVKRFRTIIQSRKKTRRARRALQEKKKYFKLLRFLGLFDFCVRHFQITRVHPRDIENWVSGQGPYCPDLIHYIKTEADQYDVFIFFTYLYYPTVVGMPLVKEKAIFIPTAHDEPPLYTKPYERLFSEQKFIMYNTRSEKNLIESHFKDPTPHNDIAGVGIVNALPADSEKQPGDFGIHSDYFIYVGRIDAHKGCGELVKFFDRYARDKKLQLVLVGKDFMGLKTNDTILKTGFIDEADKIMLIRGSRAVIMPSRYESLSMVTLEAMLEGKLVIVNGDCEVLTHHIKDSQSGFYYRNYQEFQTVLDEVLSLEEARLKLMSQRAIDYVTTYYNWEQILEKFDRAIAWIGQES